MDSNPELLDQVPSVVKPEPEPDPYGMDVDIMSFDHRADDAVEVSTIHTSNPIVPPQADINPIINQTEPTTAQSSSAPHTHTLTSHPPQPTQGFNTHSNPVQPIQQDEDADIESTYSLTPDLAAPSAHQPDRSQSPSISASASASPFPQPSASTKTTLVPGTRTVLPPGTPLQAPVACYAPLGDDPDDEEAGRAPRRKGKSKLVRADSVGEPEEEDGRLYCICQSRYDANVDRAMIACDKCENWYHLDCVRIDEDRVHLVDQFICPVCATATPERTTWKAPCAREECLQAVVPLSKYCSDYCGAEVIAARLAKSKVKKEVFWDKVAGARRVEAAVIEAPNKRAKLEADEATAAARKESDTPNSATRGRDDSAVLAALNRELDALTTQRAAVGLQLGLVESRMRYLGLAIRRWEKLCADFVAASAAAAAEDAGSAAAKPKPGKARKPVGGPTSAPEAICGFDVRLVDADEGWAGFVESEVGQGLLGLEAPGEGEEGEVGPRESYEGVLCMAPRKKCERHKGWQQVRDADFQVEMAAIEARLDRLTQQDVRLRSRIEEHQAGVQFRALYQDRAGAADAGAPGAPHDPRGSPKNRRGGSGALPAAAGKNKGGRPRKLSQSPGQERGAGPPIELPAEVFAALTRTQQRQMLQLQGGR